MNNSCSSCRFWKSDNGTDGQCRFGPPVVVPTPGDDCDGAHPWWETCWPETESSDSCGKFESNREQQEKLDAVQLPRVAPFIQGRD